jgi:hypothetical protein
LKQKVNTQSLEPARGASQFFRRMLFGGAIERFPLQA